MAITPGALIRFVPMYFCDEDGNPAAGYQLFTYEAGTSTKLDTFTDAGLTGGNENPNPIELDADGRPPDPIFMQATGYKFVLAPPDDTDPPVSPTWTVDDVEDPGQVYAEQMATILSEGAKDVTDGSIMVATDALVTSDETEANDPSTFTLLPAAEVSRPFTFINQSTVDWELVPQSGETINGSTSNFTIAAGTPPSYPAVTLYSDGATGYRIVATAFI